MKFDLSLPILSIRSRQRLIELVHAMFASEGSAATLGIDKATLTTFIEEVARGYRPNPYHNLNHATDALNTMGWFVTRPTFARNFPPWLRFLLMVSTLVHDVDHPGNDNQWEIKTKSNLANRFANKSVLEQRSVEVTRQLLAQAPTNLFKHMPLG
jgi:3',5'-cyclic-nucleotide phosphodiesterase